ncbi:MAG: T9SS type A sorting domain-containing protein [Bacteroidota bacterium]
MKKIYLLLVSLLLVGAISAQPILTEDFSSGDMPPEGWVHLPLSSGWYSSATSNAGGSAPECKFEGFVYNGTARLISPYIDMSDVDTAVLMFKHKYIKAGPGLTIGVAIADGSSWIPVWEETPNQNLGPEDITVMLTGDQIASSSFRFSFYLTGNMASVENWYIDDIELTSPSAFDCKLLSINTPGVITEPSQVVFSILNIGNTVINEVNATWVSYSGIETDSTFSGLDLGLLESAELSFDGMWVSPLGNHDLKIWFNNVNGTQDLDPDNDTLVKSIEYQSIVLPRLPLFEEFTSSTCAPCASFNSTFVPWCASNADDISLIKYQMNWPGAGDPYYTAEGGTRRNYYGVNAVPDLFCNGDHTGASTSAAAAALSSASLLTSTLDIASSFTMSGSTISVTTNILPFANSSSLKVYNIIVEKITTGNVATNGETEFEHVMMKMMPSANGASESFVTGVPSQFSYTYDMATTNVEEMDDLLVVVIVQDPSTKEVMQSAYGTMNANYSNEARLSSITLDGEALENFDPDVFEYEVKLPLGTIEEPVLSGIAMNGDALVITSMAFAIPGTAKLDVYAEDRFAHKQYEINYVYDNVGIEDDVKHLISVYPNPANDKLYINGLEKANISIISSSGSVVLKKQSFSGSVLDISNISRGVYILDIQTKSNQVIRKKIIIM